MAGYSGTPLVRKLGIKAGFVMYVQNIPPGYLDMIHPLPENVTIREKLRGQFDFMHLFAKNRTDVQHMMAVSKKFLKQDGMMWISWPKRSSGVTTDLDENVIRDYGLRISLVDIKVCAVNEIWSALKFVIPMKDRTPRV